MAARRRPGEKRDPSPSQLDQMLSAPLPAVEVVGRNEVVLERARHSTDVALDQNDGKPSLAARSEEQFILVCGEVRVPRRHEDNAGNAGLCGAARLSADISEARPFVKREVIRLEANALLARNRRKSSLNERQTRL
jgi:hypothetical protein